MSKIAVFDLDGTIIDMPKRSWLAEEFNWPNFLNWMDDQMIFSQAVILCEWHLIQDHRVVVVTARPEKYREQTVDLLKVKGFNYDELIMRPDVMVDSETNALHFTENENEVKDVLFRHHAIYRECVSEVLTQRGDEVKYAYDDQIPNLEVWKKLGANCWIVDEYGAFSAYINIDI